MSSYKMDAYCSSQTTNFNNNASINKNSRSTEIMTMNQACPPANPPNPLLTGNFSPSYHYASERMFDLINRSVVNSRIDQMGTVIQTNIPHIFCSLLPLHWRSNKSLPFPFKVICLHPLPNGTRVHITASNDEKASAELKNSVAYMKNQEAKFNDLRFLGRSGRGKSFNLTIVIETEPIQIAHYNKAIKVTVDGPREPRTKHGDSSEKKTKTSNHSFRGKHFNPYMYPSLSRNFLQQSWLLAENFKKCDNLRKQFSNWDENHTVSRSDSEIPSNIYASNFKSLIEKVNFPRTSFPIFPGKLCPNSLSQPTSTHPNSYFNGETKVDSEALLHSPQTSTPSDSQSNKSMILNLSKNSGRPKQCEVWRPIKLD